MSIFISQKIHYLIAFRKVGCYNKNAEKYTCVLGIDIEKCSQGAVTATEHIMKETTLYRLSTPNIPGFNARDVLFYRITSTKKTTHAIHSVGIIRSQRLRETNQKTKTTMKKSIIFLLLASLCIFNVDAQKKIPHTYRPLGVKPTQRTEIIFPEVNGFKCYKGDFHIHTSYSDGRVSPKGRALEGWFDGLDVIAITDHYENQKGVKQLFKVAAERVKKYEWENNDIAIIAPKQAADVVNDAHTLSHCAASFVDPIINGTENIMFIRKKNMKDIPWYTMAIDNNGNIEQIHSYQNSHLTIADQQDCLRRSGIPSYMEQIDLVPMLKKWAKEKGINVASVKERYGALCARH